MSPFVTLISEFFSRWFYERNIIIVSPHKVKNISFSVPVQCSALAVLLCGVCWASYSTGSFMAARSALKQQGQVLRTVTNAHIEDSFNSIFPDKKSSGSAPYQREEAEIITPAAALSSLGSSQLIARIKLLENKVVELKSTNEAIVQQVHDKTSARMDDFQNIIKKTGLDADELKKESEHSAKQHDKIQPAEGGPFIPADMSPDTAPQTKEVLGELDKMMAMNRLVNDLPLGMPIKNGEEQSTFGRRIDPFNGDIAFHAGLDMSGPIGSEIYSTADGTVIAAGRNGAYGNAIDIDHGHGIVTRYGHLSAILVHEGQTVKRGDAIGVQGSTGRSTGAHLHYEVRYHDQPMNPKNFLQAGQYVFQE